MNRMKKLIGMLLVCCMAVSLFACGGKEPQSATCTTEQDGVLVTMVFDAEGDKVTKITQTSSLSIEGLSEDIIESVKEAVDDTAKTYDAIDGVEYSSEITDTELTEKIVINADKDTLKEVISQGLLPIEGDDDNVSVLSFSESIKALEDAGWTVEK